MSTENPNPFLTVEQPPAVQETVAVESVESAEKWALDFDKHKKRHVIKIAKALRPAPNAWKFDGITEGPGKCECGQDIETHFVLRRDDGKKVSIGSTCIEDTIPYLISMDAPDLAHAVENGWKNMLSERRILKQYEKGMLRLKEEVSIASSLDEWMVEKRKDMPIGYMPPYFQERKNKWVSTASGDTPGRQAANMRRRIENFRERIPLMEQGFKRSGKKNSWTPPPEPKMVEQDWFTVWHHADEFRRYFNEYLGHKELPQVLTQETFKKVEKFAGADLLEKEKIEKYIRDATPFLIELPEHDEIEPKLAELNTKWIKGRRAALPLMRRIQEYERYSSLLGRTSPLQAAPEIPENLFGADSVQDLQYYIEEAQKIVDTMPDVEILKKEYELVQLKQEKEYELAQLEQEKERKVKLEQQRERRRVLDEERVKQEEMRILEQEEALRVRQYEALKSRIERSQGVLDKALDKAGELERRETPGIRWLKLMPEPFQGGTTIRQAVGGVTYVLRNEDRNYFQEGKELPYRDFREISNTPHRRVVLVELMADADEYLALAAEKEGVILNLKKELREMEKSMGIEPEKPPKLTDQLKSRVGKDTKFFNQ